MVLCITAVASEGAIVSQPDSEASRVLSLVHGQVCYLQIPTDDSVRSAAFYEAVFGWRIERPYTDFEAPGLIGQWTDDRVPSRYGGPLIWIHVSDMGETLDRAVEHGAEIAEPPTADGPDRTLATILDPAGNPIGLAAHASPA
jgi:uncharacterized protein